MAATGASAAIGAAIGISAALVTTISTVAFAVTGVAAKIDKAASKVFGEDLVKVANIAGAAFGAYSGAFGGFGEAAAGTGAEAAASSAGDFVNTMDAASDAWSAGVGTNAGGLNLAEMSDGLTPMTSTQSASSSPAEAFRNSEYAAAPEPVIQTAKVSEKTTFNPRADSAESQSQTSLLQSRDATPPVQPVKASAQAPQATSAVAPNAAGSVATNAAATPAAQRSFFDKLVFDANGNVNQTLMKTGGELLTGVGKGYAASQVAAEQRREFDARQAMYNQRPLLRQTN